MSLVLDTESRFECGSILYRNWNMVAPGSSTWEFAAVYISEAWI